LIRYTARDRQPVTEHTSADLGTADELPLDPDVDTAEDARQLTARGVGLALL